MKFEGLLADKLNNLNEGGVSPSVPSSLFPPMKLLKAGIRKHVIGEHKLSQPYLTVNKYLLRFQPNTM